jgi:hypothetical protein
MQGDVVGQVSCAELALAWRAMAFCDGCRWMLHWLAAVNIC